MSNRLKPRRWQWWWWGVSQLRRGLRSAPQPSTPTYLAENRRLPDGSHDRASPAASKQDAGRALLLGGVECLQHLPHARGLKCGEHALSEQSYPGLVGDRWCSVLDTSTRPDTRGVWLP